MVLYQELVLTVHIPTICPSFMYFAFFLVDLCDLFSRLGLAKYSEVFQDQEVRKKLVWFLFSQSN